MTDTTSDIAAIRDALAAGPTPGPWANSLRSALRVNAADDMTIASTGCADRLRDQWEGNATFIAACHPERIARLLDALEAAQKDAARYRWLAVYKSKRIWNHVLDDPQGNFVGEAIDAAMKAAP